ncbi:hypothetical protein [Marinobacter psychrophilus]|jgi:cell division protein ZapE|uniref:hypothetical protein n=1 Tax=Marinobacter psychrophilus TaxID=330734 RepID=UPI00235635D4|nr:hypothetical protein [Marinobacter psychrophilus]
MTMLFPYAAYKQALAAGFKDDPAQHRAALSLQRCYEQLLSDDPDIQRFVSMQ